MFTYFNHNQLRRYLVAFGSFFRNIQIVRENAAVEQRIMVPIEYGPKERWLTRLVQDPDFTQAVSTITPRMSYEITEIGYDAARRLNNLNPLKFPSPELAHLATMYVGVPYLINIELAILVKFQQDGMQIVEQILPYFTPDLTFAFKPIPELDFIDTIPITLSTITHSDNYEGDFEHRRVLMWNLGFAMKVYFYGPKKSQARIQEVLVDVYNSTDMLIDPPEVIVSEAADHITNEDESGHVVSEATSNTYLTTGRTARVDVVAVDPSANVATTTITEYDGDVKRSLTLTDEEL